MFTKLTTSVEMKFVLFVYLLCGHYYKAFTSKPASILLRLYCCLITVSTFLVSFVAMRAIRLYLHSSWTNMFEFIISCSLSQITSQKHLVTFANFLNTLDGITGFKTKSNLLNKTFIVLMTTIIILNILATVLVLPRILGVQTASLGTCIGFFILWTAIQLRYCKTGIVISLIHHRLNLLKKYLENNEIPVNIIGRETINERVRVVRKSLIYYDNMLDAFDAIDYHMQFEVILICVCCLIKTCGHIYYTVVSYIEGESGAYLSGTSLLNLTLKIFMAYSSCFMMVLSKYEIEQIKKCLVIQIIGCSDASLREELENLLQHLTRRPFQFTLLRAMRVDLYLSINIMTTAVTYAIIILQFTHFGRGFKS